jgi:predicted MFS family arabinose efflux permease
MGKSTPPKKRDKDKNKSSESISIKIPASAWRSVVILSASIVMILYVHTSLAPALPSMSENFDIDIGNVSWIFTVYMVSGAFL